MTFPDGEDVGWTAEDQEAAQQRFVDSGLAAQIDESIQHPERWVRLERPVRRMTAAE